MDFASSVPVVVTAGTLGVLHGVEPDHAAGLAALTGETEDARRSAVVGACFGVGHVALVIVWVLIATALLGSAPFASAFDLLGTAVVGAALIALSAALGALGARNFIHAHEHRHDGTTHTHVHFHFPGVHRLRDASESPHGHGHALRGYLTVGVVGALFTLSPPLSMIAFISVVASSATGSAVVLAVIAYAATIVTTMALVGGGVGTAFSMLRTADDRVHAAAQIIAAGAVFVLGASLLWPA